MTNSIPTRKELLPLSSLMSHPSALDPSQSNTGELFNILNWIEEKHISIYFDARLTNLPKYIYASHVIEVAQNNQHIDLSKIEPDKSYSVTTLDTEPGFLYPTPKVMSLDQEIIRAVTPRIQMRLGDRVVTFNKFETIHGLSVFYGINHSRSIDPTHIPIAEALLSKDNFNNYKEPSLETSKNNRRNIWPERYKAVRNYLIGEAHRISGIPEAELTSMQECYNICNKAERMTKKDLWSRLQSIDNSLFATGFDDFFKKDTSPDYTIKFQPGTKKKN